MTAIRRILILIVLTTAVIAGASVPAWAAFDDSVKVSTTITTTTVAAPASLTITDSCTTSTTVERRTVRTDPVTGVQTQTAYSSTTTYAATTSNVQGTTTSTVAGPGPNETTTTTTTKNTTLAVSVSWPASGSRGVSGYLVTAHLNNATDYPMAQTAPGTLSTSQTVDADNLAYQPRLSVTTLTNYGWTAQSAISGYISC
jgi:uncharacterized membrane protein